jgi:hypothetical protein
LRRYPYADTSDDRHIAVSIAQIGSRLVYRDEGGRAQRVDDQARTTQI